MDGPLIKVISQNVIHRLKGHATVFSIGESFVLRHQRSTKLRSIL